MVALAVNAAVVSFIPSILLKRLNCRRRSDTKSVNLLKNYASPREPSTFCRMQAARGVEVLFTAPSKILFTALHGFLATKQVNREA